MSPQSNMQVAQQPRHIYQFAKSPLLPPFHSISPGQPKVHLPILGNFNNCVSLLVVVARVARVRNPRGLCQNWYIIKTSRTWAEKWWGRQQEREREEEWERSERDRFEPETEAIKFAMPRLVPCAWCWGTQTFWSKWLICMRSTLTSAVSGQRAKVFGM